MDYFLDIIAEQLQEHPLVVSGIVSATGLALYLLTNGKNYSNTKLRKRYDYIIVGAGSAGCALANRLSEDPSKKVLLIEAGDRDTQIEIHAPMGATKLQLGDVDWQYKLYGEKQLSHTLNYPRGKVLGGSSSINWMLFVRGHPKDFDEWESLGCKGWSYRDVLHYFKKLEDFEDGPNEYRGVGGPLICRRNNSLPSTNLFIESCKNIGIPYNHDYNGKDIEGVYNFQVNYDGVRKSTAQTYLLQAENRSNLHILTQAQVTKVNIDNNRATGVTFQRIPYSALGKLLGKMPLAPEDPETVDCNLEVILSSGAIGSPHILLLSGIGPKQELDELNIPVVMDKPGVGKNLSDHIMVMDSYVTKTNIGICPDDQSLSNTLQFLLFKKGKLTTNGLEAGAFFKTKEEYERPDIQIHLINAVPDENAYNMFNEKTFEKHYDLRDNKGFALVTTLVRPRSKGFVKLFTSNPFDHPIIINNYLQHPEDLEDMVRGVKRMRKLVEAEPLKSTIKYYRADKEIPYPVNSTEYIREYIRKHATTLYHPVGTCKMGSTDDPMAVVDPNLKVIGIEGLRVIDASVMPTVITGNTNIPSIMVAEKGADIIKSEHPQAKL